MGLLLGLLAVAAGVGAGLGDEPKLKVGDPAPDFDLAGSDGKRYSLKQYRGRRAVVIAWFPKAFTGG